MCVIGILSDARALTRISDVIVAFTAQPGQVARFQLTAANKEENARSKGFACIGINSTWPKRSFHVRSFGRECVRMCVV